MRGFELSWSERELDYVESLFDAWGCLEKKQKRFLEIARLRLRGFTFEQCNQELGMTNAARLFRDWYRDMTRTLQILRRCNSPLTVFSHDLRLLNIRKSRVIKRINLLSRELDDLHKEYDKVELILKGDGWNWWEVL